MKPSASPRNQTKNAAKQVEAVAQKKTRKRIVIFGVMVDSLLIPCVMFLLLASMFTWVGWTQTGTLKALQFAQIISGGALKVAGVSGTLASHFQIDELSFDTAKRKLRVSGLNVIWQPRSLFSGELAIDTLNVSSLRISQMEDPTPATLPADLHLPLSVHIKNAALGRLYLATVKKDGGEVRMVQLTAITATLASSKERHVLNGALTSPWGALKIQGQVASVKPFALQASFKYLGQAHERIPNLGTSGTLSGSLEKMFVVANAMGATPGSAPGERTKTKGNKEVPVLKGGLSAVLMAFSERPLRALDANIEGVNPAHFSAGAPNANLKISVNLKEQLIPKSGSADQSSGEKKHVVGDGLAGTIDIQNALPGLINQGALPFSAVQSEMQWSKNSIVIKNARAQLAGGGLLTGRATVKVKEGNFPVIDSSVALSGINLVKFDSRLQATQIAGVIQAQTIALNDANKGGAAALIFQAQLNEPRASLQLEAKYRVSTNMSKQPESVLNVSRFDLFDGESRIHGEGEIHFDGQRKFKLKAKLDRFDPSHWIKLPSGHIDAEVALTGSLSPLIVLDAQVPKLSGVYGGQNISGTVDVSWKEDTFLTVRQLDLHWGKNSLNGSGAWGSEKSGLLIKLDAPELSAMSHMFRTSLTGAIQVELHLAGSMVKPAGRMTLASTEVGVEKQFQLDSLNAIVNLGSVQSGVLNAELTARGVRVKRRSGEQEVQINSTSSLNANGIKETRKMHLLAERFDLWIKGNREQHAIELNARLDAVRKLLVSAVGGLEQGGGKSAQSTLWSGDVTRLSLSGTPDLLMLRPTQIQVGLGELNVGNAQINSNLGKLALEHFNWKPGHLKSRGAVSDLKLIDLLNWVKVQYAIEGDLLAGADWDVQLKDNVQGSLRLARQSGDVRIIDVDGTGQALALGMADLQLNLALGGLIAGTDQEKVALTMSAAGKHLGNWLMSANSHLVHVGEHWALAKGAALSGELHVDALDLHWLGRWINPGMALNGKMTADATIAGTIAAPQYQAQINGRELAVAFASEGISLPNGSLSLQVSEKNIKLNELHFSNKVSLMPTHSKFSETSLLGQTGEFSAAGEIDLDKQSGNIIAHFKQFPLLQRKDRWVIVSGEATINQKNDVWALTGKLGADGAYFKLPKSPPPSLSSDVVVIRDSKKRSPPEIDADSTATSEEITKKGMKTYLDVNLELGPQFVFVGGGLDTSLVGTMRLRSNDGAPLRATGTIHAEDGIYEGYGQKLTIERGILNFQGAPGNPGLNILALRKGLEVEPGVEISGTVSSPNVRLVSSDSSMPDAEKLSWLVLGTGTADIAGNQAGVLMSAAGAIFGDDSGRNIPRDIVQGLGFDEISIGVAAIGGGSKLPSQTVAGEKLVGSSSGDQVVSVGKRLRPGLVLSFERGLSDASNALKLSWQLTRRVSIVARKGTEGSVDGYYTFSFH